MKTWIIVGSLLAAIAVLIGAFGSHSLKSRVSPEDLAIFETGVRYHMYHALGLIIMGILGFYYNSVSCYFINLWHPDFFWESLFIGSDRNSLDGCNYSFRRFSIHCWLDNAYR